MKTLVAVTLLVTPWIIFVLLADKAQPPSTLGLFVTLAISAFGLTMLISRNKK